MRKQSGNFLLQALLALTLVFAFMPFFANKLSSRDTEARLYSVSSQIETVHNVARIFLRDDFKNLYPNGTITFSKNPSSCPEGFNCNISILESYGLPMGFNPQTIFHQDISLVATRKVLDDGTVKVDGYVNLTRGDLTGKNLEWAQLLRMLGLYASGSGADINNSTSIHIIVPIDEPYSDVVLKHETDENIGFLTELDMNGNDIDGINILYANKGIANKATVYNLSLVGAASISTPKLTSNSATFFAPSGGWFSTKESALSLSGTELKSDTATFNQMQCKSSGSLCSTVTVNNNVYASGIKMYQGDDNFLKIEPSDRTSSVYGDVALPNGTVYVYDNDSKINNLFGMYFTGALSDQNPQLVAARDVGTRIRDTLYGNRVVLSNSRTMKSIQGELSQNRTISPDIDINLTDGVSLVPDILLIGGADGRAAEINKDVPIVNTNIYEETFSMSKCGDGANGLFNERGGFFASGNFLINSLVHNVLCQYVFYHRLERRINHKLIIRCIKDSVCQ